MSFMDITFEGVWKLKCREASKTCLLVSSASSTRYEGSGTDGSVAHLVAGPITVGAGFAVLFVALGIVGLDRLLRIGGLELSND